MNEKKKISDTDIIQDIVDKIYPKQEMGDCTCINVTIAKFLLSCGLESVRAVGGNIRVNKYYSLENDKWDDQIAHTWVEVTNQIYDFAKKTLEGYIDDPDIVCEEDYIGHFDHDFTIFIDDKLYRALLRNKNKILEREARRNNYGNKK